MYPKGERERREHTEKEVKKMASLYEPQFPVCGVSGVLYLPGTLTCTDVHVGCITHGLPYIWCFGGFAMHNGTNLKWIFDSLIFFRCIGSSELTYCTVYGIFP